MKNLLVILLATFLSRGFSHINQSVIVNNYVGTYINANNIRHSLFQTVLSTSGGFKPDSINLSYKCDNVNVSGSDTKFSTIELSSSNTNTDTLKNSIISHNIINILQNKGSLFNIGFVDIALQNNFVNSTIKIKLDKANITKGVIGNLKDIKLFNSKIIIEGDIETDSIGILLSNITCDATSSIIFKGTFKQTHTTNPLIDLGNSITTPNIILDGTFITGGGNSVSSTNPINIIVKPGCSSNVTTSANVTQLGTGIYVDPNFNN